MSTRSFEVAVIGGGIMGLYSAYWLAKSGKRVVLFEQHPIGHDNGSSHGDGRIVRSLNDLPVLTQLGTKSLEHFHDLEKTCKTQLIHHCGCVVIGDRETLDPWENACKVEGQAYEILDNKQCSSRFPQINFPDNMLSIFSPDGGVAFADRVVNAVHSELKKMGVQIIESAAKIVERTPSVVVISDGKGTLYQVQKVVVTSGAWTNYTLSQAGLANIPIYATNEQVTYFNVNNDKIDHTTNGNFPTVIVLFNEQDAFYSIPQVPHGIPAVKASIHQAGEKLIPFDNAKRSRGVDEESLKRTQRCLIPTIHPHLDKDPALVIRCLYTMTPDKLFFVGPHYDDKRFIVAAGFSGTGFKHSPMIGKLVSDMVSELPLEVDISAFALDRFNKSKL
eukprot:TRINITY_DN9817_c0_g1_i1.p1 TRINITY_DN9817_c0_g1~~TRINITY_DN9817_c0_g1_i1.p1  ORF type:complete len:390 (-),score=75.10 TRINITY_DN9817_c0_g1_i1:41-1210(-)